ncbi:MAG TPA: helix-turn-helix transcriptional regulator [Longimicrobiaceae bacterium]|nr:helix-turn-helix transcriptional regulator [Longimicrobiaceae bacterium]
MTDTDSTSAGVEGLPTTKYGTLGWLAKLCFTEGWERMEAALAEKLPHETRRDYHIVRAEEATDAVRLDMPIHDSSIDYRDFSPHPFWGAPYSVLSVMVKAEEKDYFMYHGGEEILVPVEGPINYRFFWSRGLSSPVASDVCVAPGAAIRINPQIPHHAWALGDTRARAWMVMRHASDSATSLNSRKRAGRAPRVITADALRNPTQYALVAWGLAEGIRIARSRAEVGINELAAACNIQPAQLSRLESVHRSANVSLEALWKVASYLRVPVPELIAQGRWNAERTDLPPEHGEALFPATMEYPHRLHTRFLRLEGGEQHSPGAMQGDTASWMVLKGRITLEIQTAAGTTTPEVVSEGSVIHFRRRLPAVIEARDATEILQITHALVCNCDPSARADAQP